jgi:hypothetical protein
MGHKRKNVKSKERKRMPRSLKTIQPNAAGIDMGSREHWVAGPPLEDATPNVERFGTTTPELFRLADWLKEQSVDTVAMESTGVYWIPLFEILDSRGFEVVLANARQIRNVPGRKTDMIDSQWIQLLHACGLLRGSFRPTDDIYQLRALIRERNTMVEQRSDWIRRMQKCLDQMNVCAHQAVSDITGVTGMAIIRAVMDGERDPHALARLRDRRCRKSEAQIAEQLTGNWRAEHLFNLRQALKMYDQLCAVIADYDSEILSYITRVATALRMTALTLRNSKTALGGFYRCVAWRKGASVAVFATARKLAQLIYRLVRYGQAYVDTGIEAYEARFNQRRLKSDTKALNAMGYNVEPLKTKEAILS